MIREWNEESLDHRNTLLYAMGISEEDAKRPIIGLVNTWNEMNPGHYPFDKALIAEMKEEIYKLGGLALELPISGICDGICSNTPGDRYTLPARDLVSSEVEMVANLNMLEGMVIMATCDKVVPGMLMGAVRVDIPTVMFTGGYMAAGHRSDGRMITLTHTKQAYAAYVEGSITREEYKDVVRHACPTPGACPFMGTAQTMCAMAEILGFAPHDNASTRSQSEKWHELARQAARQVMYAWEHEIRPSDILSQSSFENVVRYMMATGGSTNSLLHIPALARQADFDITPETFDAISREVPLLSTIYPNHPTYTMEDFDAAGGIGAVVKELAAAGKIDTDAKGMFGTIGDKAARAENKNHDVIHTVAAPIYEHGGLAVLHGNIGTDSAIVKFSAVDPAAWRFSGPAKCYDSQDDAWHAILKDEIVAGDVVIIRYEGPKGGPGMQEMLYPTSYLKSVRLDKACALVTDGRFSGGTSGLSIGHVSPEAAAGGDIALVRDDDRIVIDIPNRTIDVVLPEGELDRRREAIVRFEPVGRNRVVSRALKAYASMVTSADRGGVREDI